MSRRSKRWAIALSLVVVILVTGAWLLKSWLQRQVEQKIQHAVPGARVGYASVDIHYFTASVDIHNLDIIFSTTPAVVHATQVTVKHISARKWLRKKELLFDSAIVSGGTFSFRDSLYQYRVGGISWKGSMDTGTLRADTVNIHALYSKLEFGRRLGHQADHIDGIISGASIDRVSVAALKTHSLFANSLIVDDIHISVFRDRRLPRADDLQPLPAGMIRRIPVNIRLNALRIRNGTIAYEEFPKEGDHAGLLKITHANILVEPFITRPLRSDSHIRLKSQGSLMGSGKMFASMYLPFHSDQYVVKGAFENVDLTKLNSASENLGRIHIESGMLDSLGFNIRFNDKESTGNIVGIYHHLIVQPLRKHDGKKINRFKSFMLRHLIIPLNKDRSLPERKRTGAIAYRRDPTRKVSFYLLQSLLTGIKSSFKLGFLLPK